MKHTPGPWSIGDDADTFLSYGVSEEHGRFAIYGDDYCIALLLGDVPNVAHCEEANARLIAAAPELLEALEDVLAYDGDTDIGAVYNKARAAIRKARGEA